jgi:hypothetical protein
MKRAQVALVAFALVSPAQAAEARDRTGTLPEGSAAATRFVQGLITDPSGMPLSQVMVFAADAATDKVAQVVVSNDAGEVALVLPARRHNFGVLSPTLGVARLVPRGADRFTLVLRSMVAAGNGAPGGGGDVPSEWITTAGAAIFRGRVLDEGGAGLGGVRIEGLRPSGAIAATALSDAGGRFAFAVPGGVFRLRVAAPGLRAVQIVREDRRLEVVMAIAAEAQRIDLVTGRVLTFRIEDSVDPEYFPPAPVRAWLLFAYGICANPAPLNTQEKRGLKKYWYLEVLRQQPPNPARISTVSCTPATAYDLAPRSLTDGFGDLPGF